MKQMERRYVPAMDRQLQAYWLNEYTRLPANQRVAAIGFGVVRFEFFNFLQRVANGIVVGLAHAREKRFFLVGGVFRRGFAEVTQCGLQGVALLRI